MLLLCGPVRSAGVDSSGRQLVERPSPPRHTARALVSGGCCTLIVSNLHSYVWGTCPPYLLTIAYSWNIVIKVILRGKSPTGSGGIEITVFKFSKSCWPTIESEVGPVLQILIHQRHQGP